MKKVKHGNKLCLFSVCKERPGTYIRPAERHYKPNSWTNIVGTRHQTSCTFHAHSTGMLIVNIQTPKIKVKVNVKAVNAKVYQRSRCITLAHL